MSFDARREDYLRLSLRFEQTLDGLAPSEALRAYASFGRRFARERDSLPQTDADRAFHLVAEATQLIDYELPFSEERRVREIIDRGHELLSEALSLDANCIDARRMLAASEQVGFDTFFDYLAEQEPEVANICQQVFAAELDAAGASRAELVQTLAFMPHLRWLASMATQALICGRNREALQACERALEADPTDEAGVRFSAALAYAKLEDVAGLTTLIERWNSFGPAHFEDRAPVLIARAALAYKQLTYEEAAAVVAQIRDHYPHACAALIRQHEMPEGVFSRVKTQPFSEDELVVALSEATLLLQEGREVHGYGPFGAWIAAEAERQASTSEWEEIQDAKRYAAEKAAFFARGEGGNA